ncbi:MAG: hypothetical protein ACFE9C_12135 [Candidatus Hodarchaeota archaeon]
MSIEKENKNLAHEHTPPFSNHPTFIAPSYAHLLSRPRPEPCPPLSNATHSS